MKRVVLAWLFGCCLTQQGRAEDYPIQPQAVAPDSWAVIADTGYFTPQNGGFIVNTAFIKTADGVVVIGSGPSKDFGEQYRQTIERTAAAPVRELWLTHRHPDHFLGSQAFKDVPVRSDVRNAELIAKEGDGLAENLYRLVGDRMKGTSPLVPSATLSPGVRIIGGHRFELIQASGHTQSDLAVFDQSSGVLYAIDQVFNGRTPTMPNADIPAWLASLDRLAAVPFKTLVPGHGPVAHDSGPIIATRDYLLWLDATFRQAAQRGMTANEVMALPIPARFAAWAEARDELRRSVGFLYARYERAALPELAGP